MMGEKIAVTSLNLYRKSRDLLLVHLSQKSRAEWFLDPGQPGSISAMPKLEVKVSLVQGQSALRLAE